jgi:hypothetical protein
MCTFCRPFCVPCMHVTYRVKVPNGLRRQEPLANGKGVRGDAESEGSQKQI